MWIIYTNIHIYIYLSNLSIYISIYNIYIYIYIYTYIYVYVLEFIGKYQIQLSTLTSTERYWKECPIYIFHFFRSYHTEVFCEKVFVKISKNSQKNTFVIVSFLRSSRFQMFFKISDLKNSQISHENTWIAGLL